MEICQGKRAAMIAFGNILFKAENGIFIYGGVLALRR
jgi:hypothetical protein